MEKRLLGEAGCFCEQNSNRNCKQNHWKMLSNEQTVAEFLKKFQRIPKPSKFSSLKKSWSRRLRLLTPLKLDSFFSFYFFFHLHLPFLFPLTPCNVSPFWSFLWGPDYVRQREKFSDASNCWALITRVLPLVSIRSVVRVKKWWFLYYTLQMLTDKRQTN